MSSVLLAIFPECILTPIAPLAALFYAQLKALFSVVPHFTLALHPPPKHTRIAKNSIYNTFAEPPEFVLAAGLVLLCKRVWGLTEETR